MGFFQGEDKGSRWATPAVIESLELVHQSICYPKFGHENDRIHTETCGSLQLA